MNRRGLLPRCWSRFDRFLRTRSGRHSWVACRSHIFGLSLSGCGRGWLYPRSMFILLYGLLSRRLMLNFLLRRCRLCLFICLLNGKGCGIGRRGNSSQRSCYFTSCGSFYIGRSFGHGGFLKCRWNGDVGGGLRLWRLRLSLGSSRPFWSLRAGRSWGRRRCRAPRLRSFGLEGQAAFLFEHRVWTFHSIFRADATGWFWSWESE